MKRKWIALINVLLIAGILAFVVMYSNYESKDVYLNQIGNFEHTTITMERVTENYLEGEQRICNVWANYISGRQMTLEEAVAFIRESHVLTNTFAHLIYQDTKTGLSTRSNPNTPGSFKVSYANYNLFDDISWISDIGEAINITRAFTNPVNGEQSLAFCNKITVLENGEKRNALLLRVVPIAELEEKWVFPRRSLKTPSCP